MQQGQTRPADSVSDEKANPPARPKGRKPSPFMMGGGVHDFVKFG